MDSFKPFQPVTGTFEQVYPTLYGARAVDLVLWLVDVLGRRRASLDREAAVTLAPQQMPEPR